MPLLPYCVIEAELEVSPPKEGVRRASIQTILESGLRCFYSQIGTLPPDPASIKEVALEFHAVVSAIFNQAAVIPFRFPTLVSGEGELKSHLQEHAGEYLASLRHLRGLAQMEVRISMTRTESSRASGTEYLRDRQERQATFRDAASKVRSHTEPLLSGWRDRETKNGWRCYALVGKRQAERFAEMVRWILGLGEVELRVSGPWPATEFIAREVK